MINKQEHITETKKWDYYRGILLKKYSTKLKILKVMDYYQMTKLNQEKVTHLELYL